MFPDAVSVDCPAPGASLYLMRASPQITQTPRRLHELTQEHVGCSVVRLGLSTRSVRCIGAEVTVAELLRTPEADLMTRRNFGRACLTDVRRCLTVFALDALRVPEQDPRRALVGDDPSLAAGLEAPAQTRPLSEVLEELLELLARQAEARQKSTELRSGRRAGRPQRATLADIAELLYGCLTPREREVMEARFAAAGPGPTSLAEIGRKLGLSRERVRQVVASAESRMGADAERRRRDWLTQELLAAFAASEGVLSERQVCESLRRKHRGPLVVAEALTRLLLEVTPECERVMGAVWCAGQDRTQVESALERLHGLLRRNARLMAVKQLAAAFRQRAVNREATDSFLAACIAADCRFREFEGRRIGLREWEWGIPRTLDECVVACLRSAETPRPLAAIVSGVSALLPPGSEAAPSAVQQILRGDRYLELEPGVYALAGQV